MRLLFLILAITISQVAFGQQDSTSKDTIKTEPVNLTDSIGSFSWGLKGLTDYITGRLDTIISNEELYRLTMNWIKETYKMPDKVIQTSIEGEMIRIEGIDKSALTVQSSLVTIRYDLKYTIEFRFKDGRIKIDPLTLYYYMIPNQYEVGGWKPFPSTGSDYYKWNKKTNEYVLIIRYESYPSELAGLYNGISLSLFQYLRKSKNNKAGLTDNGANDW